MCLHKQHTEIPILLIMHFLLTPFSYSIVFFYDHNGGCIKVSLGHQLAHTSIVYIAEGSAYILQEGYKVKPFVYVDQSR